MLTNPGGAVVRCDSCGMPAPGRQEIFVNTGAAMVQIGAYGRRCFERAAIEVRRLGQTPLTAGGVVIKRGMSASAAD